MRAVDLPAANLRRVLQAMRAHRTPGWHLPAHWLELTYDRVEADGATVGMPIGAHCLDRHGSVHRAAVMVLADVAMAGTLRARFGATARLATVNARLGFAVAGAGGARAQALQAVASCRMDISGGDVPLCVCSVEILSGDERLGSGEATFAVLDNRRGTATHPLPRTSTLRGVAPLGADELTAEESAVFALARGAAMSPPSGASFLEAFWGLLPTPGNGGAECVFERGPHVANRVGDVQGGILLALATQTGVAALSSEWRLVDVSAKYLAAASTGRALLARAEVVQTGRQIAFVECGLTDESDRLLLRADITLVRKGAQT
jgi:uncharacterized protein (TIGR00369 family)